MLRFMNELKEATILAMIGRREPDVFIRRADGTEFVPAKIKASAGRVIICESSKV
jgi:hypothetical protein